MFSIHITFRSLSPSLSMAQLDSLFMLSSFWYYEVIMCQIYSMFYDRMCIFICFCCWYSEHALSLKFEMQIAHISKSMALLALKSITRRLVTLMKIIKKRKATFIIITLNLHKHKIGMPNDSSFIIGTDLDLKNVFSINMSVSISDDKCLIIFHSGVKMGQKWKENFFFFSLLFLSTKMNEASAFRELEWKRNHHRLLI